MIGGPQGLGLLQTCHTVCLLSRKQFHLGAESQRSRQMWGRERHKQQHRDQDEAVLAEDEPSGGRWPSAAPRERRGWGECLPLRSKPVCSPNCSPVIKTPNYSSQDKMDKTHLCFTRSHGDASWDELGVRRGAFPSPGYSRVPACPSLLHTGYNHARSCSLHAWTIECLQV